MSILKNLTPHPIKIFSENSVTFDNRVKSFKVSTDDPEILEIIEPYGLVPRCSQKDKKIKEVNGYPVYTLKFGETENLPEKEEDTYLIVSQVIASKMKRDDLLVPARLVRDEKGFIIGCLGFSIIK